MCVPAFLEVRIGFLLFAFIAVSLRDYVQINAIILSVCVLSCVCISLCACWFYFASVSLSVTPRACVFKCM